MIWVVDVWLTLGLLCVCYGFVVPRYALLYVATFCIAFALFCYVCATCLHVLLCFCYDLAICCYVLLRFDMFYNVVAICFSIIFLFVVFSGFQVTP